eukprot:1969302-Rhodomonas_salina.1
MSESSVTCKGVAGMQGTLRISMTVGLTPGSMTEAVTYGHLLSGAELRNGASGGGWAVTVAGMGLGTQDYSGRGRV